MTIGLKTSLISFTVVAFFAVSVIGAAPANAEWNPKKVTIILPHSLGGGQDRLTRALMKVWEKHLGAKIDMKPKRGASGRVGFDYWQKQPRDGTAIISTNIATTGIMYATQKPDWSWTDTVYNLGVFGVDPGAVFVLQDSKYKTINDVIEDAKKNTLLFGISSWGSTENLTLHQIPGQLGSKDFRVIPIGGGSDLVTAVLGKHLPVGFGKVSNINKAKSKVRIIAVALDTNPVPSLTGNAPTLDGALGTKTVPNASYRAILVPKELQKTHPDRLKKLKATFEAAKDDPEYIKMAKKVGIHSDLILDKDHGELQKITNGFWTAYNQEGAFFKQKQKKGELKVVLAGVKKKGKFIVFKDENGKEWKTRIHRKKTKFTINGEKVKGAKEIKKARKALKSGDECTITYIGMPIVAKSAQCTTKGSS